ncbi:MAG: putative oxidoreductase YcjS [Lentisphaerae bacterium ADurb.Bin242]|nr:MAG: putative oxidoreductase YcjS [Lentisphaerae bacterium ADurb.Bin242]
MGKKVKIGIIGCGTIGSVHADSYAKVENAELVALCDILPDRLAEKAKRHQVAKTYADYKKLLADPAIEAVSICTPNDVHAPIAIAAFKAGKHVMLEKPMTLNAGLGRKILAARDSAGKQLQMGMVWRQTPEAEVVKESIAAGRLGDIYHIHVKLIRRRGIPGLGGWFTTKAKSGGGGLIDIAVHFFDLAMWTSGLWNPTKVSAKTYSKFGSPMKDYHYISMWAGPPKYDGTFDVDDFACGFIRFGDKATMSFEVAWACNSEEESYVEFLGTKGGVKVGRGQTTILTEVDNRIADVKLSYPTEADRFTMEMRKFVDAVQGRGKVAATGEEGVVVMRLLDAIYKSGETNSEVTV